MLCAPWTDVTAVKECCGSVALDDIDTRLEEGVNVASELLYLLTAKQFSGVQTITTRPHADSICMGRNVLSTDPVMWTCACARRSSFDLGYAHVTEVSEVLIDGAALDPAEYSIVDERYLQRMAGTGPEYANEGWPLHQHIDRLTSEPGTWSVTFSYGTVPPISGVTAASKLACELVKAYARSEDCQLPGRVTTLNRQGVSMTLIDPAMLAQGLTGIYEVDLFIEAVNPTKSRGGALVWSPDLASAPW